VFQAAGRAVNTELSSNKLFNKHLKKLPLEKKLLPTLIKWFEMR
jgi:hypothetical protein